MASHDFDFSALRRFPETDAPNLFAVDASDRLILDEARELIETVDAGQIVVIGDNYGALTLGALTLIPVAAGTPGGAIRVHQDSLHGTIALNNNARALGITEGFVSLPLSAELLRGARLVLLQLPKSLAELDEIAALVAEYADPSVVIVSGGRIKHMTRTMNDTFARSFASVTPSLARQKSRVLRVERPKVGITSTRFPQVKDNAELGFAVAAHGSVFAGTSLDLGTRELLRYLPQMSPEATTAVDLGCGSGVLATALALARPELTVYAHDLSAAAVASSARTAELAGVQSRVHAVQDDGLSQRPDRSVDLIVCNPPFHVGSEVHATLAHELFADAGRVLSPTGQFWVVFNSHLSHPAALRELVGPTKIMHRGDKFTITRSRLEH